MKHFHKPQLLIFLLVVLASCSKPTLEEAIQGNDEATIRQIINSGEFDPNIFPDDGEITLFEYIVRKYNEPELVEKIASHPDLSGTVRDKAAYSLFLAIRIDKGGHVFDDPNRLILLDNYAKALYLLIKPLPSKESTLPKVDFSDGSFYLSMGGGSSYLFRSDKWIECITSLEHGKDPVYEDLVPSYPGEELVVYTLEAAGMTPDNYVRVFSDPWLAEPSANNNDFWESIQLFAAKYNGDYEFDGSMNFPDDMEIQYNTIIRATDYEGFIGWIESNLSTFSYGDDPPVAIPGQFKSMTDFENFAPITLNRDVTEFGFDLVLLESIYDYGEPNLTMNLAVYKDEELLKSNRLPESGEYLYDPRPSISLEEGKIKIFREGYNEEDTFTDVPPEGYVPKVYPDTTYYYSVDKYGELIPWFDKITIEGEVWEYLSFDMELQDFGQVRFLTTTFDSKTFLYLTKNDTAVYEFPQPEVNTWHPGGESDQWTATFQDLNGDALKDLIFRAMAITGAGPNGMVDFRTTSVYIRSGDQFIIQEILPDGINELETLEEVKEMLINSLSSQ